MDFTKHLNAILFEDIDAPNWDNISFTELESVGPGTIVYVFDPLNKHVDVRYSPPLERDEREIALREDDISERYYERSESIGEVKVVDGEFIINVDSGDREEVEERLRWHWEEKLTGRRP